MAGARALYLVSMLGATVLLWGASARLFGRRAAFFAAALFAVLGPTLHLGTFATFDAMSLFLVALAAWCVIRAADRGPAAGWMVAAGTALAAANATAYSSILFDLLVAVVALLTGLQSAGLVRAALRAATVLAVTSALLVAGALIAGSSYLTGFESTTLARTPGSAAPLSVLASSWSWAGLLVLLAAAGVIISAVSPATRRPDTAARGPDGRRRARAAGAGAAAHRSSAEQARGPGRLVRRDGRRFAVDRFIAAAPPGRLRALSLRSLPNRADLSHRPGGQPSKSLATSWPNASSFVAVLRPLADRGSGRLLVEDPAVAEYYLPSGRHWQRWSSTRNIILPSGASTGGAPPTASAVLAGNPGSYAEYVTNGYFSLVALNFADTTALDHDIAADLRRNPHYHIVAVIPYGIEVPPIGVGTYVVWRYERSTRQQSGYTPRG